MIDYGQFGNQLKQVKRMPELTTCPLTAGRWWKSEDIAACAPPSSTPAAAPGPSPSPPPGPRYATVTHQTWWWVRPSTEEDILKSSTQVWAIGNIILQQQSYRAALKIYILGKGGLKTYAKRRHRLQVTDALRRSCRGRKTRILRISSSGRWSHETSANTINTPLGAVILVKEN